MRLKYGIKNLRRIKTMENVELKRLTILVGKNSSGKSTYLRSFPLFKQSLARDTSAPLLWYGDVDFGSIEQAVALNEEKKREVMFSFEILDVSESIRDRNFSKDIDKVTIDITLDEDERNGIKKNQVENIKTRLKSIRYSTISKDKKEINVLLLDAGKANSRAELNFNGVNLDYLYGKSKIDIDTSNLFIPVFILEAQEKDDDGGFFGRRIPIEYAIDRYVHEKFSSYINEYQGSGNLNFESEASYPHADTDDLGNNKKFLDYLEGKNIDDYNKFYEIYKTMCALDVFEHCNRYLENIFSNALYLGPARASSKRYNRRQELQVSEIESDGENFPEFLDSLTDDEMGNFSSWVSDTFNFGVSVLQSPGQVSINLKSKENVVNVADTGYGVSQILPLLGMLWHESTKTLYTRRNKFKRENIFLSSSKFIAIEQPELHLHPGHQAKLAEVFSKVIKSSNLNLVVETHSEALINRIGAMISDKEINSNDVQVVVFQTDDNLFSPTKVSVSTFDEEGELVNWPYGFFNY